jgi:hypothetical protein
MNIINVQPASESIISTVPAKSSRISVSSVDSVLVAGPDPPNNGNADLKSQASFPTFNKDAPTGLGKWVPGEMPEDTTLLFSSSTPPFPSDSIHGRRKYFQSAKSRKSLILSPDNVYNMEVQLQDFDDRYLLHL